jgi:hypothetical protein
MSAREASRPYQLGYVRYVPGSAGGSAVTLMWSQARDDHAADTARLWCLVERGHFTRGEIAALVWPAIELPR